MTAIKITKENFDQLVTNNPGRVLLDFWAPWCGPCKMIGPIVEEIAEARADITVGKVNVDEEMELAMQFGVSSIPTILVFRGGKLTTTSVGYRPKAELEALLDS